jgi:Flp pilus assembly protein TadG
MKKTETIHKNFPGTARRLRHTETGHTHGQSIVEFALILPLLLVVFIGIMESGRLLLIYSSVLTSSREAARYGSAAGDIGNFTPHFEDCTGMRSAAKRLGGITGMQDTDITISYDHGPNTTVYAASCPPAQTVARGDRVVVKVTAKYKPVLPLINFPELPITSTTARTILKDIQIEGTPPTSFPTNTPNPGSTSTPGPTPTSTDTPTPTETPTSTPTPTHTSTPSQTPTSTSTYTPSPTPTNTATFTLGPSPTASNTPTPTASNTASPTPRPTKTSTPTASPTVTPACPSSLGIEVDDPNQINKFTWSFNYPSWNYYPLYLVQITVEQPTSNHQLTDLVGFAVKTPTPNAWSQKTITIPFNQDVWFRAITDTLQFTFSPPIELTGNHSYQFKMDYILPNCAFLSASYP